ncbi:MAG: FKBP-type peptidylprolyl isomerase [Chitinophagaceae bacterium]|nr:MAG: FKBP-type peptidylprolyl isomerase [Chitinophagaceae bacterium]
MKKFLSVFGLALLVFNLNGCKPDDDGGSVPLRDYQTQYNVEKVNIENFLKTHTYSSTTGQGDFNSATFTTVPLGDPQALINDPNLKSRVVRANDVDYTLYYLKLNEGAGDHPSNVDQVLAAYQGSYIYDNIEVETDDLTPVEFETDNFPQQLLGLESAIRGWGEILPQFGIAGSVSNNPGEPQTFDDFGAGLMFIPSGLAYYNVYTGTIPSYSTLIFKFKLYSLYRLDHDADGILSWQEDVDFEPGVTNADDPKAPRYMYFSESLITDDSDGDGIPNFRDVDDDNDNVLTKSEIRIPGTEVNGVWQYYPYTANEADGVQGIPSCSGDFFSETRVRRHLDNTCN